MTGNCSDCGKRDEDLRPYGKGGALICYDCGMKDPPETQKRIEEYMARTGLEVFPCGCRTWTESGTFYLETCGNPECRIPKIVHQVSAEKGQEIVYGSGVIQ